MAYPAVESGQEPEPTVQHQHYYWQDDLDSEDAVPRRGATGALMQGLGAIVSLALIIGGGIWGYKQIMRDVKGIPVVQALDGPMRRAPDNPGGQVADHTGLAVNAVQAEGTAEAPADTLSLAPEAVSLSSEDQPTSQLRPRARAAGIVAEVTVSEDGDASALDGVTGIVNTSLSESREGADPDAVARALAEAMADGAEPLAAPEAGEESASAKPGETTDTAPKVTGPGLTSSKRPQPRPIVTPTADKPAGDLADAGTETGVQVARAATNPATVPVGTRLVQLGAFDTRDEAEQAWGRISRRFDVLMEDKQQLIQKAQAGGRDFWRLRAVGFDELSDARRFCAALVAENAECIPVVAR